MQKIFSILIVITCVMSHSLIFYLHLCGKTGFWSITVSDNKLSAVVKLKKLYSVVFDIIPISSCKYYHSVFSTKMKISKFRFQDKLKLLSFT